MRPKVVRRATGRVRSLIPDELTPLHLLWQRIRTLFFVQFPA